MTPALKRLLRAVIARGVEAAQRGQGLWDLRRRLEGIVPDISDQYTGFAVRDGLLTTRIRGMHAFQISLARTAVDMVDRPSVVDIGDSSGTHLTYLKGLYGQDRFERLMSVNLDAAAVGRIRGKGIEAECMRAESLAEKGIDADIFLCFETLEHLSDPIRFLYGLSRGTSSRCLVVTVPYVRSSRMGLRYIREGLGGPVDAENTHIFELSPEDWRLLVRHAGWSIIEDRVYLQYPRFPHPLWTAKAYFMRLDFEGFFGMVLARDQTWSSRYASW